MRNKNIRNSLVINILSVIVTIGVTVLSFTKLNQKVVSFICVALLIFLLFIIIYIYISDAIKEYKDLVNSDELKQEQLELLKAMPHLLAFSKRNDNFNVLKNGDGILKWHFHIKKETKEKLQYLYFPIVFELDDVNEKNSNVQIIESKINGEYCQSEYVFKSISLVDNGDPLETGYILVPTLLDIGEREFDLYLNIKIKKLFKRYDVKEFIIVDIPYITKEMKVTINVDDGYNLKPITNFLEVHESSANNFDAGEMHRQISNCKINNSESLVWETEYPKLGYQYKISFQMEKK